MNELVKFARQTLELDWPTRWRTLAQFSSGIESGDPREGPVLALLGQCQKFYELGNLDEFIRAVAQVQRCMQFTSGSTICWKGRVDHHMMTLGPAEIHHVHCHQGGLWAWTEWQNQGRWVHDSIITSIERAQ